MKAKETRASRNDIWVHVCQCYQEICMTRCWSSGFQLFVFFSILRDLNTIPVRLSGEGQALS